MQHVWGYCTLDPLDKHRKQWAEYKSKEERMATCTKHRRICLQPGTSPTNADMMTEALGEAYRHPVHTVDGTEPTGQYYNNSDIAKAMAKADAAADGAFKVLSAIVDAAEAAVVECARPSTASEAVAVAVEVAAAAEQERITNAAYPEEINQPGYFPGWAAAGENSVEDYAARSMTTTL